MPTEAQVVTPKQIVMSPKSLMTTDGMIGLITKQGTWGYSNLAWMARMYGVKILHENGRYSTSKAQRELEDGDVRPHDLQQIGALTENSRGELGRKQILRNKRFAYNALYAWLQYARPTEKAKAQLRSVAEKIYKANPDVVIPVRTRSWLDTDTGVDELPNKVLSLDRLPAITKNALAQNSEANQVDALVALVHASIAGKDFIGVDLDIRAVLYLFSEHAGQATTIIRALMAETNPNTDSLALVQTITMPTHAFDLNGNYSTKQMEEGIQAVVESGWRGTVVYNPRGGDIHKDVSSIKAAFGYPDKQQ